MWMKTVALGQLLLFLQSWGTGVPQKEWLGLKTWRWHQMDLHFPEPNRTSLQVEEWWPLKTLWPVPHCLFLKEAGKKWGRLLQTPKELQRPEVFTARVWLPSCALGKRGVVDRQLQAKWLICTESKWFMHLPSFLYFFSMSHFQWATCSLGETMD